MKDIEGKMIIGYRNYWKKIKKWLKKLLFKNYKNICFKKHLCIEKNNLKIKGRFLSKELQKGIEFIQEFKSYRIFYSYKNN